MTVDDLVVPAGVRTVAPADPGASRVVLVRHGEAVCNVVGVVGGRRGCQGLTDRGRRQVQSLVARLQATGELADVTALYASVLPRAVETAELLVPAVGPGTLAVRTDCGLCELHPGVSDGLPWADAVARFGEPDWDRDPTVPLAPEAESWSSFVDRAASAVADLTRRHAGQRIVVACHAGVVEATLLRWLSPGSVRLGLRTAHASLTEWELGQSGWRLVRYNDAAHLVAVPT